MYDYFICGSLIFFFGLEICKPVCFLFNLIPFSKRIHLTKEFTVVTALLLLLIIIGKKNCRKQD